MDTPSVSNDKNKEYKIGILCILFCQVWWGLCPVYWRALEPIESWKIILYRVFTMFVFSYALARTRCSNAEIFTPLKDKSVRRLYFFAGLVLTANWSIYIWAMVSERVIQSAIGYYIQPIVICVVGVIFFKEKMNAKAIIGIVIAFAGLLVINLL
jgi:chloramphenicol-sensitive protein RarD